ncbi:nuclear pore complex component-domain-containing protein [Lipomyces tetrasporus]|uniref:Nuclear pore complex component-domain-containing protein n=1 Tax=Lipomyces tetrasporus TaxID=54092 RepID=A0AAD7VRL1_9ASCO|nr:nuclear pore complex component-domain-containing protein [Lipomyces tetrasporus]KAJ8099308.1 nuclear pore complex component-domain-containing protein [Lipomyces tetrasporus]
MASSPVSASPGGHHQSPGTPSTPAPYSQSPFKALYTPSPPVNLSSPITPTSRRSDMHTPTENQPELPTGSLPATPKEIPKGEWRHPAFDQLHDRVGKTEFTQATSRKMFLNALAWLVYSVVLSWLKKWNWMQELWAMDEKFARNMTYIGTILQMLFLWNIVDGLIRLLRPRDKLEDIPLTPNQRKLMGLDVNVTTSSPGKPLTPPKYVKTYPQSRESPRVSPLLKKSMQDAVVKSRQEQSPQTPKGQKQGQQQHSPASQQAGLRGSPSSQASAMGFTPSGRYLYNLADSPGRSPSLRGQR